MKDYNKTEARIKTPSVVYPELVTKLARVASLSEDLHRELSHQQLANVLGIKKQSFSSHVAKARKGVK